MAHFLRLTAKPLILSRTGQSNPFAGSCAAKRRWLQVARSHVEQYNLLVSRIGKCRERRAASGCRAIGRRAADRAESEQPAMGMADIWRLCRSTPSLSPRQSRRSEAGSEPAMAPIALTQRAIKVTGTGAFAQGYPRKGWKTRQLVRRQHANDHCKDPILRGKLEALVHEGQALDAERAWISPRQGAKHDDRLAVEWWRKAASGGHVEAQYDLGLAYQAGAGSRILSYEDIYQCDFCTYCCMATLRRNS